MSTPVGRLIETNALQRESWQCFAAHRERVTRHLRQGTVAGAARLCVLGAGNCNDLDLPLLADWFREVQLVDLDADALAYGVERQGVGTRPEVHRHGGIEVTSCLGEWWSGRGIDPRPADLDDWRDRPRRDVGPLLPGPFDVTASVCLLSQLTLATLDVFGAEHPLVAKAIRAVRDGHLDLLAHLTAPGGRGLLITDVVSSDTVAGLAAVAEERYQGSSNHWPMRNFFHGVNPFILEAFFRAVLAPAGAVTEVEVLPPWLWDLGPRVYLVFGIQFWRPVAPPAGVP